jgi:hypothetical protein
MVPVLTTGDTKQPNAKTAFLVAIYQGIATRDCNNACSCTRAAKCTEQEELRSRGCSVEVPEKSRSRQFCTTVAHSTTHDNQSPLIGTPRAHPQRAICVRRPAERTRVPHTCLPTNRSCWSTNDEQVRFAAQEGRTNDLQTRLRGQKLLDAATRWEPNNWSSARRPLTWPAITTTPGQCSQCWPLGVDVNEGNRCRLATVGCVRPRQRRRPGAGEGRRGQGLAEGRLNKTRVRGGDAWPRRSAAGAAHAGHGRRG